MRFSCLFSSFKWGMIPLTDLKFPDIIYVVYNCCSIQSIHDLQVFLVQLCMVVQECFARLRLVILVIFLLEIFSLSWFCLFLIVTFIFAGVYTLCYLIDDMSMCLYEWLIIEKFFAFLHLCDRTPLARFVTHFLWLFFHTIRNVISFLTAIVTSLVQSNWNLVAWVFFVYVPATNEIIIHVSIVSI